MYSTIILYAASHSAGYKCSWEALPVKVADGHAVLTANLVTIFNYGHTTLSEYNLSYLKKLNSC